MSDSIAATPVDGAEYRVDDGEWQSSPVFTGLKPETTYTVYQRLKGSADGNYKPSEPTSVQVTTSKTGTTSMSVPFVPEFESKTYDGAGLLDGLTRGRYDVDFWRTDCHGECFCFFCPLTIIQASPRRIMIRRIQCQSNNSWTLRDSL